MVKAAEWLKVRASELLDQLLSDFSTVSGNCQPSAMNLDVTRLDGFLMARIAGLEARCELLEAQVESMRETHH